jgi:hypothetical protein
MKQNNQNTKAYRNLLLFRERLKNRMDKLEKTDKETENKNDKK